MVTQPQAPDPGFDDEAALVARARDDPAAFARLYDALAVPIYAYCLARLGQREEAEDAASLVFAKALAALPTYRNNSFRAWLFTIAHHTIVDMLRRRRLMAPLEAALTLVDPAPTPEHVVVTDEVRDLLLRALADLPPDQRQIMALRLAGLTGSEIAQILGRNRGAVNVAQHRAIGRLRARLAGTPAALEHPHA
jgi:RNA polymerase sigma-70 factor, ECF subfamily